MVIVVVVVVVVPTHIGYTRILYHIISYHSPGEAAGWFGGFIQSHSAVICALCVGYVRCLCVLL